MPRPARRNSKPSQWPSPGATLACFALIIALSAVALPARAVQEKKQEKRGASPAGEDDSVRLRSDLVVVTVTVTDQAGRYAHGLKQKDFRVAEDDAPHDIDSFSSEEAPFAAAILIDMSGSMGYKFGLARAAAASFVESIRENDQVAVYGFNNKVRQFQDFTNVRDISDYVWDAKAEDQTRLYDCLDEAVAALEKRAEKRRAVVLISDGWDTRSTKASLDSVMKKALAAGVTIYTVDLTEDTSMMGGTTEAILLRRGRGEMKQIADQTGGRYLHSPQGDKLEEHFINVVDELRNQYTLTYYSTNQKRDGRWRKISVSASGDGFTTRARRGYYAPK
jgi:Ca-activated chloride channel family protein